MTLESAATVRSAPRYEAVAQELIQQIEAAVYPVGSKMPTEIELAETFGVSRATVRSALDTLAGLGLVSRRRRIGTVVEAVRPPVGYARTVTTMNELVQYSTETVRRFLSSRATVVDSGLAVRLGLTEGTPMVHVQMLRLLNAGQRPLCHTDLFLAPDVAERVGDAVQRPDGLVNDIIEQRTGVVTARVDQRLRARAVPGELAELLEADAGSPALEVLRTYIGTAGTRHLTTVSLHPADRFEFNLTMDRAQG
ncbi:GntR family transcriptional regulator [Nocardioides alcanivorans]|uniref:GntR family transcriptional regulator n=1 Tax=Nocardioides alcanivorans TaxID=2897352 RepID=UPI001F268275|nr:GntR family transcriptional regulator [Nocardioides alcanivorans]